MVSEPWLDLLCSFGAFSCSVFRSGAGVSNIKCSKCEHVGAYKNAAVSGVDWLRIHTMFDQDAVIMLDQLIIELRSVTKVDVDKTVVALETCCILAEYE